jgi:hypothetical protein
LAIDPNMKVGGHVVVERLHWTPIGVEAGRRSNRLWGGLFFDYLLLSNCEGPPSCAGSGYAAGLEIRLFPLDDGSSVLGQAVFVGAAVGVRAVGVEAATSTMVRGGSTDLDISIERTPVPAFSLAVGGAVRPGEAFSIGPIAYATYSLGEAVDRNLTFLVGLRGWVRIRRF